MVDPWDDSSDVSGLDFWDRLSSRELACLVPVGLGIVDSETGSPVYWNEEARRLLGLPGSLCENGRGPGADKILHACVEGLASPSVPHGADIELEVSPSVVGEGHITVKARAISYEGGARQGVLIACTEAAQPVRTRHQALALASVKLSHAPSLSDLVEQVAHEARSCFDVPVAVVTVGVAESGDHEYLGVSTVDDSPLGRPQIEAMLETATQASFGGVRSHRDSRSAWVSVALSDRDGTPLGVLALVDEGRSGFSDEEEAMIVQYGQVVSGLIALWRLQEGLEKKVEDRTAQLQQKNTELEGFTNTVAHDLRGPLRTIISYCRIVLDDEGDRLTELGRGNLTRVANAGHRLSTLVDDLLEYTRLAVGLVLREQVDMRALALDVLEELELPDGASVVVKTSSDPIECDPRLVSLILKNQFENCLKYARPDVPLVVEFGEILDGRRVFFVNDNGIGFDMTYIDKVFEPFGRLHSQKSIPGSGIGLAIVKRIVERHGGMVWGEGRPGDGATFWFTLEP